MAKTDPAAAAALDPGRDAARARHGPSLGLTLGIYACLVGLTALTVGVAYQDVGVLAAPIAVGIAALKATLVGLYFMHLRYATRLVALYAASGLLFLALLMGATLGEFAGRPAEPRVDPLAPHVAERPRPYAAEAAP